jgi:hypothetical protein
MSLSQLCSSEGGLLACLSACRPSQDTLLRGTSANPREVVLCCMAYACNVIDNVLNKLEDHRQEIAEEKLQRFLNSWPQVRACRLGSHGLRDGVPLSSPLTPTSAPLSPGLCRWPLYLRLRFTKRDSLSAVTR